MEKQYDRRKAKRDRFTEKVEIYPVFPSYSEWLDKKIGFLEASTFDLSWSGVGLKTSVVMKAGSFVKLEMELAGRRKFEILGQVTWVRDSFCGVAFTSFTIN